MQWLCPAGELSTVPSQGAALGCMVGLMSYGKRQFEELDPIMRRLIPPFHQAMDELVAMVDADSQAFSSYMVRSYQEQPCRGQRGGLPAAPHPGALWSRTGGRGITWEGSLSTSEGATGSAVAPGGRHTGSQSTPVHQTFFPLPAGSYEAAKKHP